MLIYHFGSKEALIAAVLDHLAGRLTAMLDAAPPPPTPAALVASMLAMMRSPPAQPYVAVWLEVIAGAGRGDPDFRATAARILTHFHRWLIPRLPPGTPAPAAAAARLLIGIEGTLLIEAVGDAGRALTKEAESLT
jgi:AcrR family transcriptional regulator